MKITGARVCDPRRFQREVSPPYLLVETDQEPVELGKIMTVASPGPQLKFVQHGPFWHIEPLSNRELSEEEIVGYANHAAPVRLNKLVPVEVQWPAANAGSFAIAVTRARALLRKYNLGYGYILSDVAARAGRIQWDLECVPVMCMYPIDQDKPGVCGEDRISDTINVYGTQMPACRDHISAVRGMARDLRLQRTGVRK